MIPDGELTLGLRERKRASTRARLERVSLELFSEFGFDETTVDEIAAAAGVSRITVFRYFKSKDAIVFAADDLLLDRLCELLRQDPQMSLLTVLLRFATDLEEVAADMTVPASVIVKTPRLVDRFSCQRTRWESAVADELVVRRTGERREPSMEDRLTAAVTMSAVFVSFLAWATQRDVTFCNLMEKSVRHLESLQGLEVAVNAKPPRTLAAGARTRTTRRVVGTTRVADVGTEG